MDIRHMRSSLTWTWSLLLLLTVACSRPAPRVTAELERTQPWTPAFVEHFGALPVQHEGRVMPVSTMAAFTLYAVHGRRDVQFVASEGGADRRFRLTPTEWLLDVWCFPMQAAKYPLFRIENVGVLSALGFEHSGQKQGFEYLSYEQLLQHSGDESPAMKLQELAEKLRPKKEQARTEVENHIVHLFEQLLLYHRMHQEMAALQHGFAVQGDELRAALGGGEQARFATLLQRSDAFRALVRASGTDGGKLAEPRFGNLQQVLGYLQDVIEHGGSLAYLPPTRPAAEADTWHTLGEIAQNLTVGDLAPQHTAMVASLQEGLLAKDLAERERHLTSFRDQVANVAAVRGDAGTVATESYYYAANWHFHAMMTFVLGFLIAVVACVLPRSRILWWGALVVTSGAVVMLTADLWLRCLITGHPPIARLYDTFLFIGGTAAVVLLITECVLPRRICLVLAPLAGALLILLARLFEVADGQDTMKPLQAVLLSNFWLTVHVPTINVGYAVSLAAAILGVAWLVVRAGRIDHPQARLPKAMIRAVYGVSCFGLATSVVGTITGGVWANDSWGRFWGWDPKENGALMICLSQIAMLHARMTGLVKDAGIALWSVGTGMVVIFSWFHTNLLGVGLHAYGFSDDLRDGVWISYSVFGAVLIVGGFDVLLRPDPAPIVRGEPAAPPALDGAGT